MSQFFLETPFFPLLFLIGSLLLVATSSALLRLGKLNSKELLSSKVPPRLFFRPLLKRFFIKNEWENLYFCISLTKHICELAYAISTFFYAISIIPNLRHVFIITPIGSDWSPLFIIGGLIIVISFSLDFVTRLVANLWSIVVLKIAAPFASIFLVIFFPLIGLFLKLSRTLIKKAHFEGESGDLLDNKTKLKELLHESELHHHLDPNDQKLISSFLNFKERVVKEIMVPRVDIFSLASETKIEEAARLFASEGYSRIPIYEETLDEIVGVVLYKDILKFFAGEGNNLKSDLKSISKPVIYAPESKKISQLLQEFRNKQIHMAIIVDEYGGTEGIVTIEDILEELVGEIEDEYDVGEDREFWEIPSGGWIVDAKMTLIDIENQLGVKIPEDPDYETIGGYLFHCAGTIPSKGWRISHDEFDLEVISSNERSLKKIKITPRPAPPIN